MKKKIISTLQILLVLSTINVYGQYEGCPNQGSDVIGRLGMTIRDATTDAIIYGNLNANTVYKLVLYETPYAPVPPHYPHYLTIGIRGMADGFRLYSSVSDAISDPGSYFPDSLIALGVGKDVGSSGGVSNWGIKTLPATDPNWTGQITIFKAFGMCGAKDPPGGPPKYFNKTFVK